MKILYLNTLYTPHIGGGAEITLRTLVEGMHGRGHDVIVLTTGPEAGLNEDRENGVRVLRADLENAYWHYRQEKVHAAKRVIWHLRDIYNRRMARIVKEVVRRERPDVVSCHNLPGWSAASWGAVKQERIPLVQVLHDFYNLCPSSNMFSNNRACDAQCSQCKAFRLPHGRLSKQVDAVVGVSDFILQRHLEQGYFEKARIRIAIHNARNMQAPSFTPNKTNKTTVRFGFIGRLSTDKGIELLLQVFSDLNLLNAELWVAGSGKSEYELALKRYASERIRFLGYINPAEFFPSIDVLVVPSIWPEALGMVVPEAFAYGIPVIGSCRGGIPEMIEDGVNGFLFDPDQLQTLAEAIKRLTKNPHEIEALRPKARAAANPYLNMDEWLLKYENLYNQVRKFTPATGRC